MQKHLFYLESLLIMRTRRALLLFLLGTVPTFPLLWIASDMYELSPVKSTPMFLVFTAGILIGYGTYLIAWDGSFFNRLMTLPFKLHTYLRAKFWLLFFFCVIQTLASILLSAFFLSNSLTILLAGAFFYNIGINLPLSIYMGQFNLKKIDLHTQSMVFTEQSGWNILFALLFFGPPILLAFTTQLCWGAVYIPFAISVVGLLGIALHRPVFAHILRCFERRRYQLLLAYQS